MSNLEVTILESLHALGGRATIQEIYNRILRSHVTKLHQSGEIVRVTRGTYCLTAKGCKRIGVEPSNPSEPSAIKYCVDNEFGGVVVTKADRTQTSHKAIPTAKRPQRPRKAKPMTKCPACRARVRVDRLKKHLGKVHPGWRDPRASRNPHTESVSADQGAEFPKEELNQSDHESRYADKYLGQMRRDYDGTFGSLPLYDDYGDESGPD